MKKAQQSLMDGLENYENNRSDFYTACWGRAAAVYALKAYLATCMREVPETRMIEELLPLACQHDMRFHRVQEALTLDWWPMPPELPGETVPAIAQFLCGSPEGALQAITLGSDVVTLVDRILMEGG